ncbi:SDR family NAD(P)-dependent oxidoreductase [Phytoactinopolyspora sp. XMNu-373]|uniref:SDR family NAD(P)-dependent oxidoreductase n=1 Tax=Phytoactinopolyspora mesophila TaxID=2650750 RepID=A0A7K3M9K6_9ACTN|nr:SDR family NAD(P)-dependent oxidoreductase [Phytoactinopolyspora mesophila]
MALVTGASSGIGQSTALALIKAGFEVVGTSRKASGNTDHDGVPLIALDVGDDESAKAAVQQMIDRFGRLDVLVNNAGIGSTGAAEERSLAEDERVFNINVFGPIRMAKAALPHMRAQGNGRIINISSVLGIIPAPYMAAYAASKHAIEGYTESLDHEIREFGVRALIVQPAYTKTSFEANALPPEAPLPLYAERRKVLDGVMAEAIQIGDDPAIVGEVVATAATDAKPKLRYTAGPTARRVSKLRRFAPAGAFDKQIRKLNRIRS